MMTAQLGGDVPVLLPALAHERGLTRSLRHSLVVLREHADDPELRRRIEDVEAAAQS